MKSMCGSLSDRTDLSPWSRMVRDHLSGVSERYWSGLFVYYELAGGAASGKEFTLFVFG